MDKITGCLHSNRYIGIDHEELSALELIGKMIDKTNELVEATNDDRNSIKGKLSKEEYYHDINNIRKIDDDGDFTGSWFGITRPEYADETQGAVLKNHTDRLDEIERYNEERKSHLFVDVRDFGAVGDGVTDDSSAIQEALNFCLKNGRDLVLGGSGTYCISKPLSIIPTDPITSIPEPEIHFSPLKIVNVVARNGARLKAIKKMDVMIKVEANHGIQTLGSWYFNCEGVTLDGNNLATTGIYLNYIFHATISNCRIFRLETGIKSDTSVGTKIQHCVISAKYCIHVPTGGDGWVKFNDLYPLENGRAIWLGGYAGNYHILDNVISANKDSGVTMGVFIDGTYTTTEGVNWPNAMVNVNGNEFSSCIVGVKAVGQSEINKSVWGVNIVNNHFTSSFDSLTTPVCIDVAFAFNVNISENYINTHRGSSQYIGVKLTSCDGVSIKNNKFDNFNANCIDCYNSTKSRITSNEFWNFGKTNRGFSAILLRGENCSSNFIESNVYRNDLASYGQFGVIESYGADYNTCKNDVFVMNVDGYSTPSVNSVMRRYEEKVSQPSSTVGYHNGDIVTLKSPLPNGVYGYVLNGEWKELSHR